MFQKLRPAIGARPGTLAVDAEAPKPKLWAVTFGPSELASRELAATDALPSSPSAGSVTWVDLRGLGDEALLRRIADHYAIHPLVREDLVHVPHRPAVEVRDDFQLVIARSLKVDPDGRLDVSQVGILIRSGLVLTFQEGSEDLLAPVRRRLEESVGPIRSSGADYLGYCILDTVVDGYYPVIEAFGAKIENLEDEVLESTDESTLVRLNRMRKHLLQLRRAVWPLRDGLNTLLHCSGPFIGEATLEYFRDAKDHCVQVADVTEMYRDFLNGLFDTHLAVSGNKANEIMKVLTMMASIFIPLSFMAGVYGMNFENMPELHARWSYPILLAVMLSTAIAMLFYYRSKGWLGGERRRRR
jgi:magnesium transporter